MKRTSTMARALSAWPVALFAILSGGSTVEAQQHFVHDDVALRTSLDNAGWEFVARQSCRRIPWQPDVRSSEALTQSAEPLRRALRTEIGPAPFRPPQPKIETAQQIYADSTVRVQLVSFSGKFPGTSVVAYLAAPVVSRPDAPLAVVLPGANSTPEQVFGWRALNTDPHIFDKTPLAQVGTALLAQGFTVLTPFIDDSDPFESSFPWSDLSNLGESFHARAGYGGMLSLAIAQVQASIEFGRREMGSGRHRTVVVGWAEGAFLGSIAAALDQRIYAVANLMPTRDSRAMRSTAAGVRVNAGFNHFDCTFGNVETAATIAPRPLLFAWADNDIATLRSAAVRSPRIDAELDRLYRVAPQGALTRLRFPSTGDAMAYSVARWAGRQVQSTPLADSLSMPQPANLVYPDAEVSGSIESVARYVASLGPCTQIATDIDESDVEGFPRAAARLRERVRAELGLRAVPAKRNTRIVVRQLVRNGPDYRLEWLLLRSDGEARQIGGLLATPLGGGKHPALLSFDGNYGVAQVFGMEPFGRTSYLNAYGDDFARSGVVVFVPYRPALVSRTPTLLRARGAEVNRLEFELDLARSALDVLLAEPSVDSTDVVTYGISEAAYPALLTAVFDERPTGAFFSDPLVSLSAAFRIPSAERSGAWQTQLCSTMDATMKYLVAPRRFTWEGDNTVLSSFPEVPLSFPKSIQELYRNMGFAGAFNYRRHLYGHETHPMEIREVLPFKHPLH